VSYLSEVLADNPTHYWRLADPPGGIANDIGSLLPQPLWLAPNPSFGTLGNSGPNSDGGSAVFAASNTLGSVKALHAAMPISVDWVLWWPGLESPGVQRFPWGWNDNVAGPFHNILNTGIPAFNFGTGASVPAAVLTDQRWHHFGFTYNGPAALTFNYYIDGVLQPVGATAAQAAFDGKLTLGQRVAAGASFVGAFSEFAVYNSVLSGARIAAHSAALSSTTAPPVSQAYGGLTGAGTAGVYTDLLQQILQSVRSVY